MPSDPAQQDSASGPSRLRRELTALYTRINFETVKPRYPGYFRLNAMRRLLRDLGNPQDQYRIIHVAGTKGKGSVCHMISAALVASGIRTGRYSSPHIEQIHERIVVDEAWIDDASLADALETVRRAAEGRESRRAGGDRPHSFFEIITAAAMVHFARASVQYVVLEVGLGGRLDATNVCQPVLCVITRISLDHTLQLGAVVEKIAREKAGIIKSGVPVVSGAIDPAAAREIRDSCSVHNCLLLELERDFSCAVAGVMRRYMHLEFSTSGRIPSAAAGSEVTGKDQTWRLDHVRLNVVGNHQAENASIAIAALKLLARSEKRINDAAIRAALARYSLAGRCEVVSRRPLVIVDMAHNVASIEALVATLRQLTAKRSKGKRWLIFASSQDKDVSGMLERLLPEFDEVLLTRFTLNPRAAVPESLMNLARELRAARPDADRPGLAVEENPLAAWKSVESQLGPGDVLCIAGSAFLVAELRAPVLEFAASRPDVT